MSKDTCIWPDCGHDTNCVGYSPGCTGKFCPVATPAAQVASTLSHPLAPEGGTYSAAPAVVVDEAMIDAALFCTPRGGSMDEDLAMPIDFMGLGHPEKLPLARQVMGAALAAAQGRGAK
jgi:hypothetical protein